MRTWSLTTKLIASVLALFVAVTLAIGGATVLTMNRVLEGQVAQQLDAQTQNLDHGGFDTAPAGHRQFRECDDVTSQRGPAPADGSLRVCVTGGSVQTAYTARHGEIVALTAAQSATVLRSAHDGTTQRIDLGDGLGDYVVKTQSVPTVLDRTTGAVTSYTVYSGLSMARTHDAVSKLVAIVSLASISGLILMGLLGSWLVRTSLVPLRRVAATATRVAGLDLVTGDVSLAERVPVQDTNPRTEVGAVGSALNQMLDTVDHALTARHQSEQRVRQFVADASHELRTPLASIRGYAELSRREREPVPTGVRHALDRIESEAKRMGGLVEDLLLLARLDAGRPLEHAPVDLTMMVVESVGDIRAAAPDHVWQLRLPDEAVEVRGDAGRLKQVVVNLLANARAHTPAGTTVVAGLAIEGDRALLTVRDDGPGIPDALQPNLFQRFTRGDEARNRAAGSTGLGLSIVDAVVKAHHGDVRVDSRPGSTTFTVSLPRP